MSAETNDTRSAIIDEAVEIMATGGISAVTFRAVASRVGITPMAIYHHVADKEALLVAIIERGYAIFGEYLDRGSDTGTPGQRLQSTIDGFRDFAFDHGQYFELMFLSTQIPPGLTDRSSLRTAIAPTYVVLRQRVARFLDLDPADDDAERAARALLTSAVGAIALHRTSLFTTSRSAGAEQFDHQMTIAMNTLVAGTTRTARSSSTS